MSQTDCCQKEWEIRVGSDLQNILVINLHRVEMDNPEDQGQVAAHRKVQLVEIPQPKCRHGDASIKNGKLFPAAHWILHVYHVYSQCLAYLRDSKPR